MKESASPFFPPIGFSGGAVARHTPDRDLLELYRKAGADAVELTLSAEEILQNRVLPSLSNALQAFRWKSVHAPTLEEPEVREAVLRALREAARRVPLNVIVLHPQTDLDLPRLDQDEGQLLAIENMDRRKLLGHGPEFFQDLSRSTQRLRFVLDLQHAFEHDPTLKLATRIHQAMSPRVSHLHVSGESPGRRHAPLQEATNRGTILRALQTLTPWEHPVLLEGERLGQNRDPLPSLQEEIEIVQEALRASHRPRPETPPTAPLDPP